MHKLVSNDCNWICRSCACLKSGCDYDLCMLFNYPITDLKYRVHALMKQILIKLASSCLFWKHASQVCVLFWFFLSFFLSFFFFWCIFLFCSCSPPTLYLCKHVYHSTFALDKKVEKVVCCRDWSRVCVLYMTTIRMTSPNV